METVKYRLLNSLSMRKKLHYIKIFLSCLCLTINIIPVSAQQFKWATMWGSESGQGGGIGVLGADDIGNSITTDADGNIYTTGSFAFPTDFDPGPGIFLLTPSGYCDAFVSKLDAAGNFLWARRMGGTYFGNIDDKDVGKSIATDATGNIYVTGWFSETADFGPFNIASNGHSDVFICKLDQNGTFLWVKNIGGWDDDRTIAMTLDYSGNIYTTGMFADTVDFDPGPGIFYLIQQAVNAYPYQLGKDMFISKLSTNGDFLWAKNIGGAYVTNSVDIDCDSKGNIYTTGTFASYYLGGITDFDPGPGIYNITASNYGDIFISKLDSLGNFVWAKALQDQSSIDNRSSSMVIDADDNIYITGRFIDTLDFDPGPGVFNLVTPAYEEQGFFAKYSSDGNLIWVKSLGHLSRSLEVDGEGSFYMTGSFKGFVDFDPGPGLSQLIAGGDGDIFILKLDTVGSFIWVKQITGPGYNYGENIHIDPCGNIYTTGGFGKTADFDPGPDVFNFTTVSGWNPIDEDVFVLKLSQFDSFYITVDTFILGVSQSYYSYQWYLNGLAILGATDSTYTVTENGDYTVVVTNSKGCVDTSIAYKVTNVYDEPPEGTVIVPSVLAGDYIKIYPNPANNILHIQTPVSVNIRVNSIDGRRLQQKNNALEVDVSKLAQGIYLLQITDKDNRLIRTEKFIKD